MVYFTQVKQREIENMDHDYYDDADYYGDADGYVSDLDRLGDQEAFEDLSCLGQDDLPDDLDAHDDIYW